MRSSVEVQGILRVQQKTIFIEKKNFPPVRRNLFKGIKITEKYFYQEKKDEKPNHLELRGQAPELQISWPRLTSKRLGHPAGPNCFQRGRVGYYMPPPSCESPGFCQRVSQPKKKIAAFTSSLAGLPLIYSIFAFYSPPPLTMKTGL